MILTIMISFAALAVLLINEYGSDNSRRGGGYGGYAEPEKNNQTEYSGLKGSYDKPTLKQLQNDVAELIQLKNKSLAEQRDSLLNITVPIIHARVNTLAEIVRDTMAPAFVQKLVDAIACEADTWWNAHAKQICIKENEARIQKLPALTYAQLEEVKQKGINIIKP